MSALVRVRAIVALLALSATGVAVSACSSQPSEPRIVVTTNILGDVVGEIVGNEANVVTLMKPNADPHSFQISAAEAATMENADLIVTNGFGLEEGLLHQVESAAAAGVPVFAASDAVDALDYDSDDASGADPHWWTDPHQMVAVVDDLHAAIANEIEGVEAAAVSEQATSYRQALVDLAGEMEERFAELGADQRVLVTNHHVFGYLAHRFDFRIVGAVIPGGTTLAAPSASDLSDLADAVRDAGVRTIFAESSQPDRLVQVLAEEAGIEVGVQTLFTESLTNEGEGAETYLDMMQANTERIVAGLS